MQDGLDFSRTHNCFHVENSMDLVHRRVGPPWTTRRRARAARRNCARKELRWYGPRRSFTMR
jgi:hypothetical protein